MRQPIFLFGPPFREPPSRPPPWRAIINWIEVLWRHSDRFTTLTLGKIKDDIGILWANRYMKIFPFLYICYHKVLLLTSRPKVWLNNFVFFNNHCSNHNLFGPAASSGTSGINDGPKSTAVLWLWCPSECYFYSGSDGLSAVPRGTTGRQGCEYFMIIQNEIYILLEGLCLTEIVLFLVPGPCTKLKYFFNDRSTEAE